MSERMNVKSIIMGEDNVGKDLVVNGWVKNSRNQKQFSFLDINDGSIFTSLQVIVNSDISNYSEVLKLSAGCSVRIMGQLVKSAGKGQTVELIAKEVHIYGFVDDPDSYPIAPKPHSLEHLRQYAHLRPRSNLGGAVARVRNTISNAIHSFFNEDGFVWVATPIITASDCEGAGEMFRVSTLDLQNLPRKEDGTINFEEDFFGKESFLTVSGQLNGETYACALSKIYTFGPTFRAENSNTSRHLAEFWMVEPEVAFNDLKDNAYLAENMLKYVAKKVLDNNQSDMAFFNSHIDKGAISRLEKLATSNFVHMDYTDGIKILENCGKKFENPVHWGVDLASEHERYLAEEYVRSPVVLMNYPKEIKAFYMRLSDDEKTVAAMDVLAPGIGEIIGGSQREERYDVLVRRMIECGLDPQHYSWYLDLRRYGTVPHAGFGLGLERLISYVTGMNNVRDVIPFARTPKHIAF